MKGMKNFMKKNIEQLKYIKIYDIFSVFIFIFMIIIAVFYKIFCKFSNRKIWLVCEEGKSARDNGYHFFKYIRTVHPEINCYYVIDKKSSDYSKVVNYGNIIQFRGFKHWLYYLCSEFNISSQKNGNPAQALFYIVHVKLGLFNNRIFLQHGVTKDMCDWLLYKNTKFRCFICGAKKEYEYVEKYYGYPKDYVQYIGFARFDNLHDCILDKKSILVMPTWRNWIGRETNSLNQRINFKNTDFFMYWNDFLNNSELISFIENNGIILYFYPHINMQKFLIYFKSKSKNIKFVSLEEDIQDYLKKCPILVTDYSSVFMDFGYMRKSVIYYQFDKEEYRKNQYKEGYFKYERDGFGPVFDNCNDVVEYIKKMYLRNLAPEKKYLDKMNSFFELNDEKNCERHYNYLMSISKK